MEKSDRLQVALAAANEAADIIQSFAGSLHHGAGVENKVVDGSQMGLVTEADLSAEKAIINAIKKEFPGDSFLAEESQTVAVEAEHLWVIDPLDGTNNFAHGIPHYSTSIGYYHDGTAKCGVITNPATGETFLAEQGRGAWIGDDTPVQVSPCSELNDSIIATGFYYDRGAMMRATLATIQDLFELNIRGIRRFGSAALDLAFVGTGRFDAFFEYYLSPWDFGAGRLFVEEAGGKVTDCDGGKIGLKPTHLLASNHRLHEQLQKVMRHETD